MDTIDAARTLLHTIARAEYSEEDSANWSRLFSEQSVLSRSQAILRSLGVPDDIFEEVLLTVSKDLTSMTTSIVSDQKIKELVVNCTLQITQTTKTNAIDRILRRVGFSGKIDTTSSHESEVPVLEILLKAWLTKFSQESHWKELTLIHASDTTDGITIPIDDVFVDIEMVDSSELERFDNQGADRNNPLRMRVRGRRLFSDLLNTTRVSIVVGEPGSGKTTIIKRLAHTIFQSTNIPGGGSHGADLPIVIELGRYAKWRGTQQNTSIASYLVDQWRGDLELPDNAALVLQQQIGSVSGVLLLFDGWDEVPFPLRKEVAEELFRFRGSLPAVITSRPSGYPERHLAARYRAAGATALRPEFYVLTGLNNVSIGRLAKRLMNAFSVSESETDEWIEHVINDKRLCVLARSPAMLTAMCLYASQERRASRSLPTHTYRRSEIMASLVAAAQQWQKAVCDKNDQTLSNDNIRRFASLCFSQLGIGQDGVDASYEIEIDHCQDVLGSREACRALLSSRLVTTGQPGQICTLHASVHEYLASTHAVIDVKARTTLAQCAAVDQRAHEVLRFFVDNLQKSTQVLWDTLRERLDDPDRFGIIEIRAAYLLQAAGVSDGGVQLLGIDVRSCLWNRLQEHATDLLVDAWAHAAAALDQNNLAKRCIEYYQQVNPPRFPTAARQYIARLVSRDTPHEEGFNRIVNEQWDMGISRPSDGLFDTETDYLIETFGSTPTVKIATELGTRQDSRAVPVLIRGTESSDPKLIQSCIFALANIRDRIAIDKLISLLLKCGDEAQAKNLEMALSARSIGALDREGRDRLLRLISCIPVNNNGLHSLLAAVVGMPLGEFAEVIVEVLTQGSYDNREVAAELIEASGDLNAQQELVTLLSSDISQQLKIHARLTLLSGVAPPQSSLLREWALQTKDRSLCAAAINCLSVLAIRSRAMSAILNEAIDQILRDARNENFFEESQVFNLWESTCNAAVVVGKEQDLLDVVKNLNLDDEKTDDLAFNTSVGLGTSDSPLVLSWLQESVKSHLEAGENPKDNGSFLGALKSLAEYHPGKLAGFTLTNRAVHQELAKAAASQGVLVFDDAIMSSSGILLGGKASSWRSRLFQSDEAEDKLQAITTKVQSTHGITDSQIPQTCIAADQYATNLQQAIIDGDEEASYEQKQLFVEKLFMIVHPTEGEEQALDWFFNGLFKPEGKKLFRKGGREAVFGSREEWQGKEKRLQEYLKKLRQHTDSNTQLENALLNIGLRYHQWRKPHPDDGRFASEGDLPSKDD